MAFLPSGVVYESGSVHESLAEQMSESMISKVDF